MLSGGECLPFRSVLPLLRKLRSYSLNSNMLVCSNVAHSKSSKSKRNFFDLYGKMLFFPEMTKELDVS